MRIVIYLDEIADADLLQQIQAIPAGMRSAQIKRWLRRAFDHMRWDQLEQRIQALERHPLTDPQPSTSTEGWGVSAMNQLVADLIPRKDQ